MNQELDIELAHNNRTLLKDDPHVESGFIVDKIPGIKNDISHRKLRTIKEEDRLTRAY